MHCESQTFGIQINICMSWNCIQRTLKDDTTKSSMLVNKHYVGGICDSRSFQVVVDHVIIKIKQFLWNLYRLPAKRAQRWWTCGRAFHDLDQTAATEEMRTDTGTSCYNWSVVCSVLWIWHLVKAAPAIWAGHIFVGYRAYVDRR